MRYKKQIRTIGKISEVRIVPISEKKRPKDNKKQLAEKIRQLL